MATAFLSSQLKRFLLYLSLMFVMVCDSVYAGPPWILASVENEPPWAYLDKEGHPKGIIFDVAERLSWRLGMQLIPRVMPFRRVYSELLQGRAHLSAIIVRGHERRYPPGLVVGKEPIVGYRVVAITLKASQISITSLEQLRSLHIGNIRLLPQVDDYLTEGTLNTEYSNTSALLKGLLSRRVDVIVTAEPSYIDAADALGVLGQTLVSYELGYDHLHFVWSEKALGEQATALSILADLELQRMKQSGELAKIISVYANFSRFRDYGVIAPGDAI